MLAASEFLATNVIGTYVPLFTDPRNQPGRLVLLERINMVPATDYEIIFRMLNRVLVADIVADDQRALTYRQGYVQAETNSIPNIKHGVILTQEDIARLNAVNQGGNRNNRAVADVTDNLLPKLVQATIEGVMQRLECLAVAMFTDSASYNRYGIKISGSFGMPADLNPTVSVYWTDAANATPVNDVLTLKLQAQIRYGMEFDRMTMSSQAFRYMIATAEFQTKSRTTLPLVYNAGNIPQQNIEFWKNVAQNIMNIREIEFYDRRFFMQDDVGASTAAPFWPINKVAFSVIANDGNDNIMDIGNAVTVESQLRGFLGNEGSTVIGDLPDGERGPMAYATVPSDLNPPNITAWGVARAYPRKLVPYATACLTVGTFADQISPVDPFITLP